MNNPNNKSSLNREDLGGSPYGSSNILIRITGQDRPGLTASIMEILAKYDTQILDIGQADIHSTLSLGILIRVDEENSGRVMKELLFKATELQVNIGFAPITDEEYEAWVGRQGKNRYILTIIGRHLAAKQIGAATKVIAEQGFNIDSILRLSGRPHLETHPNSETHPIPPCLGREFDSAESNNKKSSLSREDLGGSLAGSSSIQFSLRGKLEDRSVLQHELMKISSEFDMDFSFQRDDMFRRMRRLICFDMDSTLIQTECIDELAIRAGVGDQVKAITESAMRGEIDFKESFTRRVALLKGLDVSVMKDIAEHLPITEGADRLMEVLKRCGYKIAILSGGFTYFGEYLQRRWGIDYVYANELEIDENGKLTGRYVGEIVDGHRKAELLKLIAQVEKVNLAQTIAVGDGANDLPMIAESGLGIAFHAKPRVVATAKQSINTIGLDGVLYFLGFKDSYLNT
jgi:phosphoserine phosphatase